VWAWDSLKKREGVGQLLTAQSQEIPYCSVRISWSEWEDLKISKVPTRKEKKGQRFQYEGDTEQVSLLGLIKQRWYCF